MPVETAIDAADDLIANGREGIFDFGAAYRLAKQIADAGLRLNAADGFGALAQLVVRQRNGEAARLLKMNGDAAVGLDLIGKPLPQGRGAARQFGVGAGALPFALNPYQREVGARGAKGDVMLIEDADARAAARHAPGQRRSDQPAADHRNIVIRIHAILLSIMCAVRFPEKLSFVPGCCAAHRPGDVLRC